MHSVSSHTLLGTKELVSLKLPELGYLASETNKNCKWQLILVYQIRWVHGFPGEMKQVLEQFKSPD